MWRCSKRSASGRWTPPRIGVVTEEISFSVPEKQVELTIRPAERFKMTVNVDYGTKVLSSQQAVLDSIETFVPDVYNCRTFVFLDELQFLIQNNLARGGDLDNAIVFVDKVPDHKVLNALGDYMDPWVGLLILIGIEVVYGCIRSA